MALVLLVIATLEMTIIATYLFAHRLSQLQPKDVQPSPSHVLQGNPATAAIKLVVLAALSLFVALQFMSFFRVAFGAFSFLLAVRVLHLLLGRLRDGWRFAWSCMGAGLLTVLWMTFPNWLTLNLMSVVAAIGVLGLFFSDLSFRTLLAIGIGIMIYDLVAVFGPGQHMVEASNLAVGKLPVVLTVPSSLDLSAAPILILGLGDVILPGFVVMFAFRLARRAGSLSFVVAAMCGQALGLGATMVISALTARGQPATIYLMPGVLLGVAAAAWQRNALSLLWQHPAPEPSGPPDSTPGSPSD